MILLTAPHAFCLSERTQRHCDRLAKEAAKKLQKALNEKKIPSVLFLPSTPRFECDLNRDVCKNHPYRQQLREFASKNRGRISMSFDVHSFPPDERRWAPYDLVILDDAGSGSYAEYTISLLRHCKNRGMSATVWSGKKNSIQAELRAKRTRNLLLEFNESLDSVKLSGIASCIADWVKVEGYA